MNTKKKNNRRLLNLLRHKKEVPKPSLLNVKRQLVSPAGMKSPSWNGKPVGGGEAKRVVKGLERQDSIFFNKLKFQIPTIQMDQIINSVIDQKTGLG